MTPIHDLTPAQRRRLFGLAVLRVLAVIAVLVTLYYVLPLDDLGGVEQFTLLALGLLAVVVTIGLAFRRILGDPYPGIRAAEGLAITAALFVLLFSATYFLIDRAVPASFSQHLTRTDALYFTVVTFSTVGYGDITATSQAARIIVILQIVADLSVIGFGVRLLSEAVQYSRQRQVTQNPPAPSLPPVTATENHDPG